jgi:hypothetical protein
MMLRSTAIAALVVTASIPALTATASAISLQECSAKYKAAQSAGSTKGLKWNDFRKAECSDAAATPAAAPPAATAAAPKADTAAAPKAAKKEPAPSASAPAAAGNATFPSAVSPKYSTETEGKARMHTCLDQYNANKTGNGNGGMKWIEKGGGYYSECNKRLKG